MQDGEQPRELVTKEEEKKMAHKYAKDKCVVCGSFIPDKETNYIVRGNYCSPCNGRITGRGLRGRMKKGRLTLDDFVNLTKL